MSWIASSRRHVRMRAVCSLRDSGFDSFVQEEIWSFLSAAKGWWPTLVLPEDGDGESEDCRDGDRVLVLGQQTVDGSLMRSSVVARAICVSVSITHEVFVLSKCIILRGGPDAVLDFSDQIDAQSAALVLGGSGGQLERLTITNERRSPVSVLSGDWHLQHCALLAPDNSVLWPACIIHGGRVHLEQCLLQGTPSSRSILDIDGGVSRLEPHGPRTHARLSACKLIASRFAAVNVGQGVDFHGQSCEFRDNGCILEVDPADPPFHANVSMVDCLYKDYGVLMIGYQDSGIPVRSYLTVQTTSGQEVDPEWRRLLDHKGIHPDFSWMFDHRG